MDYIKDHEELTATTASYTVPKWGDWITDDLMKFVREVPLDSDAVANIPLILRDYDKQKSTWQRIKCLFL